MWIMVLNRIDNMAEMNDKTESDDITQNIDLMTYLEENYVSSRNNSMYGSSKPEWMKDHNDGSS